MREISLHILDIVENSIEAGATEVELVVDEDRQADVLSVTVSDNGRGMDEAYARAILDPFVTSRTTRRVGLGLPLIKATAERCAGVLSIESTKGKGTTVKVTFQLSHIDRPPLGDMKSTLLSIAVGRSDIRLHYVHRVDGQSFEFDTAEVKNVLGETPLSEPAVLRWLNEYLEQDIKEVA
jgi:anti-sigma regulatory factor (Ser/Thr protein kinase)